MSLCLDVVSSCDNYARLGAQRDGQETTDGGQQRLLLRARVIVRPMSANQRPGLRGGDQSEAGI